MPGDDRLREVSDADTDTPVRETGVRLFEDLMAGVLPSKSPTKERRRPVSTCSATPSTTSSTSRSSANGSPVPPGWGRPVRAAPLLAVCGGGLFAHRYASASGFRNPSVYCADLAALILHIRDRLRADLAGAWRGLPELDPRGT